MLSVLREREHVGPYPGSEGMSGPPEEWDSVVTMAEQWVTLISMALQAKPFWNKFSGRVPLTASCGP